MATLSYGDITDLVGFTEYVFDETVVRSKLIRSGTLMRSQKLEQKFASGGTYHTMPSLRSQVNAATAAPVDDTSGAIVPIKQTNQEQRVYALRRAQAWGKELLAEAVMAADPFAQVAQDIADYEASEIEKAVVSQMVGYIADNVANDASSKLENVSGGSFIDGVTNWTVKNYLASLKRIPYWADNIAAVLVHPIQYIGMKEGNLIDTVADTENTAALGPLEVLKGTDTVVIQSPHAPVTGNVYSSFIIGRGSLHWAPVPVAKPIAVDEEALDSGGAGSESIVYRMGWAPHMEGMSCEPPGGFGGGGPSNTELETAANWTRAFLEDEIGIVELRTREA